MKNEVMIQFYDDYYLNFYYKDVNGNLVESDTAFKDMTKRYYVIEKTGVDEYIPLGIVYDKTLQGATSQVRHFYGEWFKNAVAVMSLSGTELIPEDFNVVKEIQPDYVYIGINYLREFMDVDLKIVNWNKFWNFQKKPINEQLEDLMYEEEKEIYTSF